jgi:hypothetical protein
MVNIGVQMENNLKIISKFNKPVTLEMIKGFLEKNSESNLLLTASNETYYIQKSKIDLVFKRNYLDFFMLQFTVLEAKNSTMLTLSSQTRMIGLLIMILFIPLIWILVVVFSIVDGFEYLDTCVMIIGASLITFILFLIQRNTVRLESKIVIGLRNLFE